MGIVVRQSLKAGVGSYLGVLVGVINQMYVSTEFLSVEQYALSRILFENSLLFASFAHLGTPFIVDRYFSLFRNDEEKHGGILSFLLMLPLVGVVLFALVYWLFTPLIVGYFSKNSALLVDYHFLVLPLTVFWIYITVLDAYCRNNSRIAVPMFIREVYLRVANVVLVIIFGIGWVSFDWMLYLIIAAYGFAVVLFIIYIGILGKGYWRWPDRTILTRPLFKQMLGYGSFTVLGALGVNVILFIDRTMLAGERDLVNAGIFIVASYMASVIEIPRKALAQISIPILTQHLRNEDFGQLEHMNRKTALHLLLSGGLVFLLIWVNIDDIFFLLPKSNVYSEGKYVVLFLLITKLFDMAAGLNTEIILYSKYYRMATWIIIFTALLGFFLNLWLISSYGFIGAAIATSFTTLIYSLLRMGYINYRFGISPYSPQSIQVLAVFGAVFLLSYLVPEHPQTPLIAMVRIVIKTGAVCGLLGFYVWKWKISEEVNGLIDTILARFK
ncbi:lipopolysaccharide biosynthesis protein [Runella slithyformis]|uniref:Polysaccharide biosynthesis protein n=1 Tax=Runella slithyformis (strain ATCC 29530 / DSM 19594 / LMG 11500 / NCIMB 11436 / LSU 4) TaxID=761193 RepID=A0A7U3ZQ67_RUNSL|nr:polysaccharide biosynthesis C-terminal domain-containing protein [Runella slithyformis]AEI51352.1 polysaccharide biosynthesis protein [Runella slithyformis DSM 19594]